MASFHEVKILGKFLGGGNIKRKKNEDRQSGPTVDVSRQFQFSQKGSKKEEN